MGFIYFILIFYVIPLSIIKLLNRYLRKNNHETVFEYAFGPVLFACLVPILNISIVILAILEVSDCIEAKKSYKTFKKRIIKWMS